MYTLKAHRAYAVGEQVCISYGDRANQVRSLCVYKLRRGVYSIVQDLLETYGFVLPGNPYDTCTLSLPQALTPEPGAYLLACPLTCLLMFIVHVLCRM